MISVSGDCMRCILKTCQIVASISVTSQFHKFSCLFSDGFLLNETSVVMADEADTDRSGHVRNGRLLFHHIKGFFLRFKAKKIVKWQQPRWLAMSTPEVRLLVWLGLVWYQCSTLSLGIMGFFLRLNAS